MPTDEPEIAMMAVIFRRPDGLSLEVRVMSDAEELPELAAMVAVLAEDLAERVRADLADLGPAMHTEN